MPNATPYQWDVQVLKDLGVPQSAYGSDINFLERWQTRETGGGMPDRALYNLLATTQTAPGSYPINSAGVQAFTSLDQGAQVTSDVLHGGLYTDLLGGLMGGTLDPNASYQGLHNWSAGPNGAQSAGYWSLSGIGTGNPNAPGGGGPGPLGINNNQPGQDANALQKIGLESQAAIQQKLQQVDDLYAQQSADFQRQLLMLNEQSLQVQEGALKRLEGEAPLLQQEVQKQYYLEYAGIAQAGQDTNRKYRQSLIDQSSQNAATGAAFTKGARDTHANTMADWSSAISGLQRERATLQSQQQQQAIHYLESIAAMRDQQTQYDIQAEKYGISSQEITSRLANSLGQINSGAALGVADIMTQIAGLDAASLNNIQSAPIANYTPGTTYGVGAFDPFANNQTGQLYG